MHKILVTGAAGFVGAWTVELFHLPEAHYDMVRPGNALFGNYPSN